MVRCPNCGSTNELGARFCGECGQELTDAAQAAGSQGRRNLTLPLLACGGLGVLFACAASVAGLFLLRADEGLPPLLRRTGPDTGGLVLVTEAPPFSTELPPATIQLPPATITETTYTPQTTIYWAYLEHNVCYEDENYMVVHVEFEVEQRLSAAVDVEASIWTADGSPMEASDAAYSMGGQVGTVDTGAVEYAPLTYWEDFQLSLPYSEIELGEGQFLTVDIIDRGSGDLLASFETETFDAFE